MAQINKPDLYFNTKLYTGNGSTNAITGVGFQPDFIWCKARSIAYDHRVFNSISGVGKYLDTGNTGGESSDANSITAFGTDGFTLGSEAGGNVSGQTFVSWNWLAGGTASSNTDGSITSSVSANTTAGFSIVSYTGTGSASTIGHSLGVAPKVVLVKNRDGIDVWVMQHGSLADNEFLEFNNTSGKQTDSARFNGTAPTSTVFSVGTSGTTNGNTEKFIAYCFAEKKGFSKFGSYTGNGNSDGTFVYTGFKPAFVIVKRTDTTGSWRIFDNKRSGYNVDNDTLYANLSDAEYDGATYTIIDILSNGWKFRDSTPNSNASGGTYIYMAFAENPLVGTNNIPATAR